MPPCIYSSVAVPLFSWLLCHLKPLAFIIVGSKWNRPGEAVCVMCVDFACQLVASQYGEVTQETDSVSPLSGKQNGCAIKSAFRRSACCPSLPAANPFALSARPWRLLLCTQPQLRWISAKCLTAHRVFIGRTVQPHNVQNKPISCWSNLVQ